MVWPGGLAGEMVLRGRARDLLTPLEGEAGVVAEASMELSVGPDRVLRSVVLSPEHEGAQTLTGAQGGGRFRSAVDAAFPGERAAGTPLYLLLDDVAGATLIGGFAWTLWPDELTPTVVAAATDAARRRNMAGICSGFRPGGGPLQLKEAGEHLGHNLVPANSLDSADPLAWHDIEPPPPSACMRRRRRIDVWLDDAIRIEAMFRDSMWNPDGQEICVHEYRLDARADPDTGTVLEVHAEPRVLPFRECPLAAPNAAWLAGAHLSELRDVVLMELRGTDCCTHLNDMLRALAEVPVLLGALTP